MQQPEVRGEVREDPLQESLRAALGRSEVQKLAGLDLHTVGDLLRHLPRRYLRLSELTSLDSLPVDHLVTLVAQVASVRQQRTRQGDRTMLLVTVTDGQGTLSLTFFHRAAYHHKQLSVGRRAVFTGKVTVYRGSRQLAQPGYELLDEGADEQERRQLAARPLPVYPAGAGLTSAQLRGMVRLVLDTLPAVPDPVPPEVLTRFGLPQLGAALRMAHLPQELSEAELARRRFVFEEALVLQVALARRRQANDALAAVPRPARADGLRAALDQRLPFALTDGQREVGAQIEQDLARSVPMHRLLQGEVGSGKTVVALRAMLTVVDAGGQAALLAPTEVLAGQHFRSLSAMLGELAEGGLLGGAAEGTRLTLVTGSLSAPAKRAALLAAASGQAGIVVGTHALLSEAVSFADLGLVVVDEQHRFGVEQRDALRAKAAQAPHVLVMTATPIPRTVAMTVFGDLDISTLHELPAGRSPIATHVVPTTQPSWVDRAWERVREEVDAGRQAFVVCSRIGDEAPAEEADPQARPARGVLAEFAALQENPRTQGLRMAVLHGRLPVAEREQVMRDFAAGRLDLLVATTVIEVGVDVPNASVMVVLDADRFGVSQLHQLRGRVGRGAAAGLCLLVTDLTEGPAAERLAAVAASTDGFALAQVDLEQRREGDVLGVAQSGGRSSLRLLRVLRDEEVIQQARAVAIDLVRTDPQLRAHPALARLLQEQLDAEREAFLDRG